VITAKFQSRIFLLLIILLFTKHASASTTRIDVLRENDASGVPVHFGSTFTVTGITISKRGGFGSTPPPFYRPLYIQDETGGICLYDTYASWDSGYIDFGPGTRVTATGELSQSNGLTVLVSRLIEVSGSSYVPPALVVTCARLSCMSDTGNNGGERYESKLIKIVGVRILDAYPSENSNGNVTIQDSTGWVTMHIDKDTDIDGTQTPDYLVDVVGIASQYDYEKPYNSGYQLLPRGLFDITRSCISASGELPTKSSAQAILLVSERRFKPFQGEELVVQYNGPETGMFTLRVFDLKGRCIRTLGEDATWSPYPDQRRYCWNGRTKNNDIVSPGIYIIHLQLEDTFKGKSEHVECSIAVLGSLR